MYLAADLIHSHTNRRLYFPIGVCSSPGENRTEAYATARIARESAAAHECAYNKYWNKAVSEKRVKSTQHSISAVAVWAAARADSRFAYESRWRKMTNDDWHLGQKQRRRDGAKCSGGCVCSLFCAARRGAAVLLLADIEQSPQIVSEQNLYDSFFARDGNKIDW